MTHKKICKLAECGKEFETKAHNAEYCSESHKFKDYRRNNPRKKQLGSVHNGVLAIAKATPTQRPQLDALGDFMVRSLERERDKLEAELKELRTKYEKIKDEKAQLEKEADQAVRKLEEKPTGLSGILQTNPQLAEQALTIGAPLLAGLAEKVINWLDNKDPQKQLSEANAQGQGNEVYTWLVSQTPEIQKSFVMLLEGLQASGKIQDYLNAWNRSFMGARKQASATVTH
jgi:hypothetical protein